MSAPTITLNDGVKIPKIGFGLGESSLAPGTRDIIRCIICWLPIVCRCYVGTTHYGKECVEHLVSALKTGYTYIDCAQMYKNSKSVKDALEKWGGKRENVFILQKCEYMNRPCAFAPLTNRK